jgi:hypothetical protein
LWKVWVKYVFSFLPLSGVFVRLPDIHLMPTPGGLHSMKVQSSIPCNAVRLNPMTTIMHSAPINGELPANRVGTSGTGIALKLDNGYHFYL